MSNRSMLILSAFIALSIALGFTATGGPLALGAHPFWAAKTGYIGALVGAFGFAALGQLGMPLRNVATIAVMTLIVATACVFFGKQTFVASFAEDAIAGRFWYIGWYVAMGAATALVAALLGLSITRRQVVDGA